MFDDRYILGIMIINAISMMCFTFVMTLGVILLTKISGVAATLFMTCILIFEILLSSAFLAHALRENLTKRHFYITGALYTVSSVLWFITLLCVYSFVGMFFFTLINFAVTYMLSIVLEELIEAETEDEDEPKGAGMRGVTTVKKWTTTGVVFTVGLAFASTFLRHR